MRGNNNNKKMSLKFTLPGDRQIWWILFLLNIFGFVVQFSAKAKFNMETPFDPITSLIKPLGILLFSFYIMYEVAKRDYYELCKYVQIVLYASWVLILIAYFFGPSKGGANRWLNLGPISFMPSDMAKLGLVVSLSKRFAAKQIDNKVFDLPFMLIILIEIGLTCFLIMLSNFSTSFIVFITCIILMYFGRVPTVYIIRIILFVGLLAGGMIYFNIGQRAGTAKNRIEKYVHRIFGKESEVISKEQDRDDNFQLYNGYMAIATGGLSLKGPGKSHFRYHLSQAESDFVYAIIIEEYGIMAGILIPLAFFFLMWKSRNIIVNSIKPFGGLLAGGLTFAIVSQAYINMFVCVGLLPTTGQPIQMISAGGTSLFFTSISMGLVLSVSQEIRGKR